MARIPAARCRDRGMPTQEMVVKRNNFYFLFSGLLLLLLAEPLLILARGERAGGLPLLQLAFALTLALAVWSLQDSRRWFRVALLLVALDFASALSFAATGRLGFALANAALMGGFCLVSVGIVLRKVVEGGPVTPSRLVGAACAYMLLGILWALAYTVIDVLAPGAFNIAASADVRYEMLHLIYFSFVTITTVGYGDITPIHPLVRTLAYLEAVTGQLYMAVLVASLVGRHAAGWQEPAPRP